MWLAPLGLITALMWPDEMCFVDCNATHPVGCRDLSSHLLLPYTVLGAVLGWSHTHLSSMRSRSYSSVFHLPVMLAARPGDRRSSHLVRLLASSAYASKLNQMCVYEVDEFLSTNEDPFSTVARFRLLNMRLHRIQTWEIEYWM